MIYLDCNKYVTIPVEVCLFISKFMLMKMKKTTGRKIDDINIDQLVKIKKLRKK